MRKNIQNNKIVSTKELNIVVEFLKGKNLVELEIYFEGIIEKIDIVFIAGLILYNKCYNTKFSVQYKEYDEYERLTQTINETTFDTRTFSRIFEVRHYLKQFQEIFKIEWTDVFNRFKGIQPLTENDFIASRSFAPIIFVSKDNIKKFFKEPAESQTDSELFNLNQKYLNVTGNNNKEKAYLNSENSIIKLLPKYPPIYTFVFTVLYNKISPFVKSVEKGITNPSQRTEQLWEFTKEFVKGLHELAKNIVEHSETGEGMITIRAYSDEEANKNTNKEQVLETHVFDFGTKGIVPKLIEDTTKNKEVNKVYEDDLKLLNGTFTMKDFIAPSVKTKLNQQLYREIAHYGLMKFYKLVERNNGVVISSSIGNSGKLDFFPDDSYKEKTLSIGTAYFFQLPFKSELFKTIDTVSPPASLKGSPQTISGLSELMNLKIRQSVEHSDIKSTGQKVLLDMKPDIDINNRDDEVKLFKLFAELKDKKGFSYISIDMKNVNETISDSSLLRFLAHLSTNYSQAIILYNLEFELYDEMIENNKQFFETLKDLENVVPFWYENKGVLIFTGIKDMNFNFADILYGRNKKEFQAINYIVSHTFQNTLSIIKGDMFIDKFVIPDCLTTFFFKSALLPFDLLLYNDLNKTLFQSNLETLLMQDLNVNKVDKINDNE